MLFASVIKNASLVQLCLLLPTSFFVSDVVAWQAHNPNSVTTGRMPPLATTIRYSSSNMFLICQPLAVMLPTVQFN